MKSIFFSLLIAGGTGTIWGQFTGANDSVRVNITSEIELNSATDDYGSYYDVERNTVFFTSRRGANQKKAPQEFIYMSKKEGDKWSYPVVFSNTCYGLGVNMSITYLSQDARYMMLYRDAKNGQGDIYESFFNGTEWSLPVPMNVINSRGQESSACLTPDKKRVYFISDREGGMGGRDIWFVDKKNDGSWSPAINAGPSINSSLDEEGISFSSDGKIMYFSSKGFGSIGGYDVFLSENKSGNWSTARSLGAPVNTVNDDLYFAYDDIFNKASYSSRNVAGNLDLVHCTIEKIERKIIKKIVPLVTTVNGFILDQDTQGGIGSFIQIGEHGTDNLIASGNSDEGTGKFDFQLKPGKTYDIYIEAPGYMYLNDTFTLDDSLKTFNLESKFKLKKLKKGAEIELKNIFYEYASVQLKPESLVELDKVVKLMEKNPTLRMELRSHTDARGSDVANLTLSQKRSNSVVTYILSKGIDPNRIISKGLGETDPVVPLPIIEKMTNVADKEAAHAQNRRTEFLVL